MTHWRVGTGRGPWGCCLGAALTPAWDLSCQLPGRATSRHIWTHALQPGGPQLGGGGCGVWDLGNSEVLKPHKPQAARAGEGAWWGQHGRPLGFFLQLWASVLTDGTGGPEQDCGAPDSPSLGPQPPPLTPHFSLGPEGAFGGCAGRWGRHGARGQANRASGKGMQMGGICMSSCPGLQCPLVPGEVWGSQGSWGRALMSPLVGTHPTNPDQGNRQNIQPWQPRSWGCHLGDKRSPLLRGHQGIGPRVGTAKQPGPRGSRSSSCPSCVTLGKPLRLSGPFSPSLRCRERAVTRRLPPAPHQALQAVAPLSPT